MTETRKFSNDPAGPDDKGALEDDVQKIQEIHGSEVLGHEGEAREEHSGQNSPRSRHDATEDLADNAPGQMPGVDLND